MRIRFENMWYFQARAGTVPGKGNDFFLPNPFWFVIHSLPVT